MSDEELNNVPEASLSEPLPPDLSEEKAADDAPAPDDLFRRPISFSILRISAIIPLRSDA